MGAALPTNPHPYSSSFVRSWHFRSCGITPNAAIYCLIRVMAPPRPFLKFCVVQASLLRRTRPRLSLFFIAIFFSLAFFGVWWLSLSDCSTSRVDDAFEPAYPLEPFPQHVRVVAARDARARVDVVYVTAFPRNALSSLRSLCYFAGSDVLGTIHLVVPDRMAPYFASPAVLAALQCPPASAWPGTAAPVVDFKVWPESQLVPRFAPGAPFSGTTRQMTLKLAAAKVVSTPFYLVMDSDVYARRPFSRRDLFDSATGTRARVNIDQNDFCQPATWFNQASRALGSRLVADTEAYCCRIAFAGGYPALPPRSCPPEDVMGVVPVAAPSWFIATGNASVPDAPFGLIEDPASGRSVYGACRSARGHASHVTPAILSRDIVVSVLAPRVESTREADAPTFLPVASRRSWLDALLDFHEGYARGCRQGSLTGRFYSWTEYTLYFVAAVASNAMGQYHSFAEGGITSIKWSMMKPYQYDEADWSAIFNDDSMDLRPFFIVHSWFSKSIEQTDAHLAPFIPTLKAEDTAGFPAPPSPAPFW